MSGFKLNDLRRRLFEFLPTFAHYGAGVVISEDQGATWTAHGNIKHPNTWLIENAVAELSTPRKLLMAGYGSIWSIRPFISPFIGPLDHSSVHLTHPPPRLHKPPPPPPPSRPRRRFKGRLPLSLLTNVRPTSNVSPVLCDQTVEGACHRQCPTDRI